VEVAPPHILAALAPRPIAGLFLTLRCADRLLPFQNAQSSLRKLRAPTYHLLPYPFGIAFAGTDKFDDELSQHRHSGVWHIPG
jgi:hypothetical protein